MTQASPTVRHAARVILLDEADRVLLVRFEYAGRRWWATPGGALEGDETHAQAGESLLTSGFSEPSRNRSTKRLPDLVTTLAPSLLPTSLL